MDLAVHAMARSIHGMSATAGSSGPPAHSCLWSSPGPVRRCQCHSPMRRSAALVRTQRAHWKRSANSAICRMISWRRCVAQVDELAAAGRVLGCSRSSPIDTQPDQVATLPDSPRGIDFEYVGLIGFADPLRSNVPAAVAECRSAGIRVLMITGDYPATARAIGGQAGLDATRGAFRRRDRYPDR